MLPSWDQLKSHYYNGIFSPLALYKNNKAWETKTSFFVTARQQSCGKVMVAVMSVCLSFCLEGSHVAIAHDALDLTVLPPPPWPPPDMQNGDPQAALRYGT